MILEREIEKLLLRKEEKLEIKWKDEENTCLEEVGGKEGLVGARSLHLDRSLALEMDCDWEVNDEVEQQQSFHSSQDAASQTDLFASELGRLKQAMEDVSLEERHSFTIEEDDCALNVHLEEGEGQEEVLENTGNVQNVDVMERSIQEELKASLLPDNVESMKEKENRSGMLRSPICDKSIIVSSEEEEDLSFEREAGPSSVDCAVNTKTEEEISTKSGSIKNLLAWLLLLLALFTTFGAFRVDHKVHLPSTWLLLYHLFGSSLPLPVILVEYDSNPRPHIN